MMLCGERGPRSQPPAAPGPRGDREFKILILSGDAEEGRDANTA